MLENLNSWSISLLSSKHKASPSVTVKLAVKPHMQEYSPIKATSLQINDFFSIECLVGLNSSQHQAQLLSAVSAPHSCTIGARVLQCSFSGAARLGCLHALFLQPPVIFCRRHLQHISGAYLGLQPCTAATSASQVQDRSRCRRSKLFHVYHLHPVLAASASYTSTYV